MHEYLNGKTKTHWRTTAFYKQCVRFPEGHNLQVVEWPFLHLGLPLDNLFTYFS